MTTGWPRPRISGLEIISSEDTYEPGTADFYPVVSKVVSANPTWIVLSGALRHPDSPL